MFERYTEPARQVVVLAQEEARLLKHNYIGTEHLLLGLLREHEGIAAHVLRSHGITAERVRAQLLDIVGPGDEAPSGQIPFTPRAKKVLELTLREALSLSHNYIDTEHILLGLLREGEGVAARILLDLHADPEKVRDEVVGMLPGRGRPGAGFPDTLVDEATPLTETVAREIEDRLGRPADAGDLLVTLASVADGLAARTLARLGVDADSLKRAADEARAEGARSSLARPPELVAELKRVRAEKAIRIRDRELEEAAGLLDAERELMNGIREHQEQRLEETLEGLRGRLGLG